MGAAAGRMARAGPRAVGGDRAAGGAGGGRAAGPWREGVPGQSQGPGPGAGSVPAERGQGRPVRCPGAGRLAADGSRPPDGAGAEFGGGAGARSTVPDDRLWAYVPKITRVPVDGMTSFAGISR